MGYLGALILFGLVSTTAGQTAKTYACKVTDETAVQEYLSKQTEYDAFAEEARRPRQGRLPFCWHSCAVNLPIPYYPESARRMGVRGVVTVYTIADEDGKIIYAESLSGPKLLRNAARQAACKSAFNPIQDQGKRMKFPWTIKYNFEKATDAQIL
jgi:TonB family protein